MSAKAFTFPIRVLPADIDFMGHVNNARYLGWVQDAVLAHWNKLAPAEEVASKAWVALKHEITYRKPAFLEDDVVARTVLEHFQGARAFYHTVISRGEEVLAEVKSSWCCIDAATLRPARIGDHLREFFFPDAN
jgi:acyl-CoA thioester hydrolase